MLTNEEYAKEGGVCPACGSDEIEGDSITVEGTAAFQAVSCLVCYATWEDVYRLTGYRNLDGLENANEEEEEEEETSADCRQAEE